MEITGNQSNLPAARLLRRLVAMFYDTLLLLSVLLITIAFALMLSKGTFTYHNPFFRTLLFLLCFMFYSWFWLHGGQTLGMRAWRMRLQQRDGRPITLWQALVRFMVAIPSLGLGGLGLFWMLVDRERMTLHDRLSGTVVVLLPKK
jgi:uncharacterized RDD family membrane protein YckC